MKTALFIIAIAFIHVSQALSQTLIVPEKDSTFFAEYQDGTQWAFCMKDSLIVGIANKTVKDDYGFFYQLNILVKNMSDRTFDFDPATVEAFLVSSAEQCEAMKVYTAERLQKKIQTQQTLTAVFMGLNAGLNAANAGYQTSYVSGPHGTYYIQTYNAANAALTNMMATNQLMLMSQQMKADREMRDVGYLKRNTIHPGEGICGYMMVKRKKGKEMTVHIQVDEKPFEVSWNLQKKGK